MKTITKYGGLRFKQDELDALEQMVRRQGYKSAREMILDKLGMKYADGRRAGLRSAGIESAYVRNENGGSQTWDSEIILDSVLEREYNRNARIAFEEALICK